MEWARAEIKKNQTAAHSGNLPVKPRWPVLVLRMLKGLGGPAYVRPPHSTHRAHQVRASSRTRRLCRQCRCGPRGPAQWLRQPRLHPRTRVQVHRRPPRRRHPSPRLLACLRPRPPAALCTLCRRHLLPLHVALVIGCRPHSPRVQAHLPTVSVFTVYGYGFTGTVTVP
ncbi:hypothetical protein B0H10DRAFT_255894 [Mycena sp. CBHHK59/15]|nr:hypothetical protein B0H10DRAFT_255894 [Mycena sp. CBHHK59/15]